MIKFTVKNLLNVLAVVAAVFFCSASVSAETFKESGLFYKILNDREVEVAPAPDIFYYIHDVVIPETVTHEGKTYSVTAVGDMAFENCRYLSSVKLGNNITELGEEAFGSCTELTSIKFPPSLVKIRNNAFYDCRKLSDIQFSGNLNFIGEYAFGSVDYNPTPWLMNQPKGPIYVDKVFLLYKGNCPETVNVKEGTVCIAGRALESQFGLGTVNLPSSLKFIGGNAFSRSREFANLNFANVENIEYIGDDAFIDTRWLKNLPYSLVYLGKVLFKCKNVSSKNFTVKDGTLMIADYAFDNDSRIESVSIPNSVKFIGIRAFGNCSVKSIVLPEGLKELKPLVFDNCTDLESVRLPSTLESLYSSAFTRCLSLKQIDLPANLKEIRGGGFKDCKSLAKITVEEGSRNFCVEDGILFSKDKKTLIAIPGNLEGDYRVPDFVETIGSSAFSGVQLKSLTIPASVSKIGRSLFGGSKLLESVTFEPGSNVKIIPEYSFASCDKLKTLVLPDSLEEIEPFSLQYCYELDNIKFPETLKRFDDFGNTSTKWYKNQPNGVVYAGKLAFRIKGSFAESTLAIKGGTKGINRDFCQWSDITELVLPENLEHIGSGAFKSCSNLAVIKGGSNAITQGNVFSATKWLGNLLAEDNDAYRFGKNILYVDNEKKELVGTVLREKIEIEEGVENLSLDYDYNYNSDRKSIPVMVLPESLKYIQQNSFKNYQVVDTLIVKNIIPIDITKAEIGLDMYDKCTLCVPEKAVDAYRNARGWNVFRNIVGDPKLGGVETIETTDAIRVFADGGDIVIEGVDEGTPVEVFNLNGQTVYRGVETRINVPVRGIYIVRVEGRARKVAM